MGQSESCWVISNSLRPRGVIHGILQAKILEWVAFASPGDLPNPVVEPRSPSLQVGSLPAEPPGKPKNTGVDGLSLLQGVFPTQELNWGLLHCPWILYQLIYETKSRGNQAQVSKVFPSGVAQDVVNSSNTKLWQLASSVVSQGSSLKTWCLGGFLVTWVPSASHVSKSSTPRRKAGVHHNRQFLYEARHREPFYWRMERTVLRSRFSDASQGPTSISKETVSGLKR